MRTLSKKSTAIGRGFRPSRDLTIMLPHLFPILFGSTLPPAFQATAIELSVQTTAEDVALGGFTAAITTENKPGDWGTSTYTIDSGGDPDSKFDIDGTVLENDATFDFETAESHLVTITDTPSGPYDPISRQFTISVTDVAEPDVTVTFIQSLTDATGLQSYTLAGNWGTLNAGDRLVLAFAAADNGGGTKTFNSVSVAGHAATEIDQHAGPFVTTFTTLVAAYEIVPAFMSGETSGNIVVAFNTTMAGVTADLYRISGAGSGAPGATDDGVGPTTLDTAVDAGSAVIGISSIAINQRVTWAGLANEGSDRAYDGNNSVSTAYEVFASAGTKTITCDTAGTESDAAYMTAKWPPA